MTALYVHLFCECFSGHLNVAIGGVSCKSVKSSSILNVDIENERNKMKFTIRIANSKVN